MLRLTQSPLLAVFACTHTNTASDAGTIAEGEAATDACECDSGVILMRVCASAGEPYPPYSLLATYA